MPVQIACPSCQRQLRVPDNLVGQMVKCPSCENTFVASVEEGPPAPSSGGGASDFQEEPRQRRSQREENYEEEPRPSRRRSRDDDEFEDRPRRRREPHRGQIILILGILGILGVGAPITGIIAWVMGNGDMQKIRAGTMDPEGESNTNIGRILGMISTLLWLFFFVAGCGCFCLMPMLANA